MPSAKPPHAPLASPDDIEQQFYEALQQGDIEKLMAVWSDDDDIACVHPGGPRVIGAAAIRASFDAMFANGAINAHAEKVRRVVTLSSAVHSVLERVQVMTKEGPQSAWVIATNVYMKTAQGWRLVAHHASPGTPREVQEIVETASVLH
ncbi:YybH family protein [Piscinibacter sp.]|jgi:ketosteroid isomerase-like protein|uniref:YybH family protein n=1 Tax=Piscinibacter sp. TaxID=1903157 RepID=UPI002F41E7BB